MNARVGVGRPVRFYRVRWNHDDQLLAKGEGRSRFYARRSSAVRLADFLDEQGYYVQVHEADRDIHWQQLDDDEWAS